MDIVAHGFFRDFEENGKRNDKQPMAAQSQPVVAAGAVRCGSPWLLWLL